MVFSGHCAAPTVRCRPARTGVGAAGYFFLSNARTSSGVAGGGDVLEDVEEALFALVVGRGDEEGGALDAFDDLAVHVLGLDEVEAVDELHVGVGEEVVGEVVLGLELLLVLDGVAGDAEDGDAGLLELGEDVAEAAGLDGAAGGVGAGVEEEDYGGGLEVGEGDGVAVLVVEGEVFDGVVDCTGWACGSPEVAGFIYPSLDATAMNGALELLAIDLFGCFG